MGSLPEPTSKPNIAELIGKLDSLIEGDRAAAALLAIGNAAVPYLSHYLLTSPPRTIALPRCRAVRVLGDLGACSVLLAYFRDLQPPSDPAVLFAEDAVRSTAAQELAHWKTEETFAALLEATIKRATSGLIHALGEFQRAESLPVLFELLEDDLCREDAKEALLKMPQEAHGYGTLLLRNQTATAIHGPASLRRRRATFQLLADFDLSSAEWKDLKVWLTEDDAEVVITVASIGLKIAPTAEHRQLVEALFRVSKSANWVQEDRIISLLEINRSLASNIARTLADQHLANHEVPDWRSPFWRILRHVLGDALGPDHRPHRL